MPTQLGHQRACGHRIGDAALLGGLVCGKKLAQRESVGRLGTNEFVARNTFFGIETVVAHQDGLPTLNARDSVAEAFTCGNVRRNDVLRHQRAHTIVHQNEVIVAASLGLQPIDAVVNRLHPRLATFENPPQFGDRKLVGIRA